MPLQFTENIEATRAQRCERVSCQTIIQPGEPRLAVGDVTGHVKYVCKSCHEYYSQKEAQEKMGTIVYTGMILLSKLRYKI
jgi:predicted metal-binding protein